MNEKYNTVMPETDDRTLCMQIDKPISKEGYRDNFIPRIKEIIDKHGEIRILIYFKQYDGWEEQAAGFDIETTVQYGRYVKKLAFINPSEKMIFNNKIREPLIKGDTEYFEEEDLDKAIKWVKN